MALRELFLGVVLLAAVATGTAAAQDTENTVQIETSSESTTTDTCEVIDSQTALCDSELEEETAVLTLHSDTNQRITFTDAGSFMAGGVINTQTRTITEGRSEIRMPVTEHGGFAGVSITTDNVAYAVPLEEQSSLLKPPVTSSDVQAAAGGGAVSVSIAVLFITWRAVNGKDDEPERVA